jgi:hypothetical protein
MYDMGIGNFPCPRHYISHVAAASGLLGGWDVAGHPPCQSGDFWVVIDRLPPPQFTLIGCERGNRVKN